VKVVDKINVKTPENIELHYQLAGLASRAGAVIIDSLIQGLFLLVIALAVVLFSGFHPELWETYYGWIVGVSLVVLTVVIYSYYIVAELKMNGRTPGKKILKLRTIRQNGEAVTLKDSAIRNLFRVFIDLSGLGALFIFFSSNHQRIGDFAAATIVIHEDKKNRSVAWAEKSELADLKKYLSQADYQFLTDYYQRQKEQNFSTELRTEVGDYFKAKYSDSAVFSALEEILD
jgi:uncharacterized RDD family membrane protein YckC